LLGNARGRERDGKDIETVDRHEDRCQGDSENLPPMHRFARNREARIVIVC
jgi:hypothetical protein